MLSDVWPGAPSATSQYERLNLGRKREYTDTRALLVSRYTVAPLSSAREARP